MKRFLRWFPYFGLVVLAVAIAVRSAGFDGLELLSVPEPPVLDLQTYQPSARTESIAGRVLSAEGAPVAEVLVMAEVEGELMWTHSDPQGRFALGHLLPGPLSLTLVRRAQDRKTFQVSVPDEELELLYDAKVSTPPSLPEIGESELNGEVLAAIGGRGLLGYEVQLIPMLAPETMGAPIPVRTRVGADRRFRFQELLYGDYRVRLLPPWAVGGTWPNLIAEDQGVIQHAAASKTFAFQQHSGEVSGRLIDVEGDEVVGALVRVTPLGRPERPWIPVLSNDAGQFQLLDLPPGTYELRVEAGEDRYLEVVDVRAGETSLVDARPIRLRIGPQ